MERLPVTYIEGYHDVDAVKKMEYRQLGNTGLNVSKLSFGVSALGSVFRETNDEESWNVVEHAVKSGINWIDAAPFYGYGKAERVLGEVGRYEAEFDKMFDFSAVRVTQSVDESLERIGVDYIDLLQVHDMEFAPSVDIIINETLPALQKVFATSSPVDINVVFQLKESGKIKYIGITGYPLDLFKTVIERSCVKIDTILTYCRYCLNDTSLVDHLSFLKSNDIGIINASPTGMGLLTNRGTASWHPASDDIKETCRQAVSYCQERNVDISRLALYFTCSNRDIPTTLVSTASLKNIQSNIHSCCDELTCHEQEVLDTIRERFFMNNKTWEGIEVDEYRKYLAKMNI